MQCPTRAGRRILLVTAVAAERDAVARALDGPGFDIPFAAGTLHRVRTHRCTVDLLAAGVGPAAAAVSTATALTTAALTAVAYDLVICVGIGGGFQPGAPVGSLVVADELVAADLGAETAEGFVPLSELGFGTVAYLPDPELVREVASVTGARRGCVLTVSTVTGSERRAAELRSAHPLALVEAMEGFGVAEAGAAADCPVLELRAVSNPVGHRDRASWRVAEALAALTAAVGSLAPALERLACRAARPAG
ncbi:futalosine hydrolase [Streptomyces sp. NPDC006289]|uniref:futalosine hydrolase n=1 Tax=Streptomyces sp. NPDC006289 TaxID=3156744 RepID=UPI0033A2AB38